MTSSLSKGSILLPNDADECNIRYTASLNYFVIDPNSMEAKSGHDFPRTHETFRLQKKSERTFQLFHDDSKKFLCVKAGDNQLLPCDPDDKNKAEFELDPLIDISTLEISEYNRCALARFFLLKLDGEYIKLKDRFFERKQQISKEDLEDIALVDVASFANLYHKPHPFDFFHSFQGILNDDTNFLNFDFIGSEEAGDFKVSLYRRQDNKFQIFSFRGTQQGNISNLTFDILSIGLARHYQKHSFKKILGFIDSPGHARGSYCYNSRWS